MVARGGYLRGPPTLLMVKDVGECPVAVLVLCHMQEKERKKIAVTPHANSLPAHAVKAVAVAAGAILMILKLAATVREQWCLFINLINAATHQ